MESIKRRGGVPAPLGRGRWRDHRGGEVGEHLSLGLLGAQVLGVRGVEGGQKVLKRASNQALFAFLDKICYFIRNGKPSKILF